MNAGGGDEATFLAFDHGERYIGVAVGQSVTGTASPLATVNARNGEPDWEALDRLVDTWQPTAFVLGDPLDMDGRTQATTRRARRFRRALEERYGREAHLADERLTTTEARAELARQGAFRSGAAGRRRMERAGGSHPLAARIILEAWLRERHDAPTATVATTAATEEA